jgi:hypothetical protein
VSGVARDPASTSGDGIDRVELFVGNRDLGGTEVGAAVPQQGVFAVTAKLPGNVIGGTSFFAYAHSSVTGQETAVSVPVFLGAAPTPTPRSGTDVVATPVVPVVAQASCVPVTSSSAASASTAPTTTGSNTAPVTAPAVAISGPPEVGAGAPVLQLGHPNAGDTLLLGDYVVSGLAYVPGLAGGAGVDHVDFFLGSRDAGGTFLGSAVPGQSAGLAVGGFATRITVPNQNRGGTTMFFAYAQNSVTGQETVVTVPVSVGVAPTPTPRPTN